MLDEHAFLSSKIIQWNNLSGGNYFWTSNKLCYSYYHIFFDGTSEEMFGYYLKEEFDDWKKKNTLKKRLNIKR
jgi:hypothetical protein